MADPYASRSLKPQALEAEDADSSSSTVSPSRADSTSATKDGKQSSETETTLEAFRRKLETNQRLKAARGLHPVRTGLSLAWRNLSVRGLGGIDEVIYGDTFGSLLLGPFASMQDRKRAARVHAARGDVEKTERDPALKKGERFLLHDLNGTLKVGEMMLVLGRPGAGCTTFLKTAANIVNGYSGVDGNVMYGSHNSHDKKALKPIANQIVFNSDDELHLPNLKVGATLDFALANKTPAPEGRALKSDEATVPTSLEFDTAMKDDLLTVLDLKHTVDTKVGDQAVRGVSGGQRKRVSIAEVLASRPAVQFWDKPTRGLDANTALQFTKIVRCLADVEGKSIAVSLYQAGNAITQLFDKILVLAEGQTIYFGPQREAQAYMESLGFEMLDGANVSDFLTGVTSLNERRIRKDFQGSVPNSTADFVECYRRSHICQRMQAELDEHLANKSALEQESNDTLAVVQREKHKSAARSQPYTVGLGRQIKAAFVRELKLRTADKFSFWARQGTIALQSFVIGSAFYDISDDTNGLFLRGGASLLAFIFPSLLALGETTAAFEGRAVLSKHNSFKLFRPTALVIAQVFVDIILYLPAMVWYALVIYWMAAFKAEPGPFFIFLLFAYITTLTMTSCFRAIGAAFPTFEDASKVSGFVFTLYASYSGYFISAPAMRVYLAWVRWINPLWYGLEAMVSNEIGGRNLPCAPNALVPGGPGYTSAANQGCTVLGATAGSNTVSGDSYLAVALEFYHSHIWRNLGILSALWALFIFLTALASEGTPPAGSKKAYLLYKRGATVSVHPASRLRASEDNKEEKREDDSEEKVMTSNSIFTWKNLSYTVRANGQDLKLLDNVQGWCKPGQLTALMGSSGAGKTTLLDVLAQRKDSGVVKGEVLINGQALPISFQRSTGYAEQLDIHLPQSTVREALEFSALLRQPRSIPDKQKLAYVDAIIDLLEMHDLEDALIGVPGAGLGIEQRKRLTLAVELVAKPRLLFADEPTSGLDGQSAFTILQFLRKLASAGQSVLVTVHQPSASLFAAFDTLLLLKAGGKTVYFGAIDQMPAYFEQNGVPFPRQVNPAEYMIDVVSGDKSRGRDWSKVWLESENYQQVTEELEHLKAVNKDVKIENKDDKYEFAASASTQLKLVVGRASVQIWRQTDYVVNKIALHVGTGLLNGFSFWMIPANVSGLQQRLFTSFGFLFVAPGVIGQAQPKFLANRDIFEQREKKAKIYSATAFITAEILAELPYLILCGTIYAAVWLAPTGLSWAPNVVGPVILEIYLYELLYTGIGQAIAAYTPTATAAAQINPSLIGTLVLFNGAFIPYAQIQSFWRYWLYYLDPFKYVMGSLLVFQLWDQDVRCSDDELARFVPPAGQTCGQYAADFLSSAPGYLIDLAATDTCEYCAYSKGSDYLKTLNLAKKVYGWRDLCITLIFVLSSYSLVYVMMKARTKKTKAAKSE